MQDHGTTWTRALGLALVALLLLGGRGPAAPAAFGAELVNASGRWSFGSAAEFLRADAADRLGERVRDLLVAGVERGDFASAVGLVAVRGETVVHEAVGSAVAFRTPDEPLDRPIPARPDTIYDIASITKLFTATAALQLVEQGKLDLDVPIATYLPGLAKTFAGRATTRQLLTHTAGFPPGFGSELRRAGNDPIRALALVEGRAPHGAKRVYSDIGLIALGEVVAAVSGERLDAYVARHIAEPLRLTETRYLPPAEWRARIAATEAFDDRGAPEKLVAWGEVHDPTAWRLGGVAGHAGLFSTARDLARFGQAVLNGGALDGARVLRPETVALMTGEQVRAGNGRSGLGWELDEDWYMGRLADGRAFGHTGFTGTSLVLDVRRGAVVVLLTNRLHPTPRGGNLQRYRQGLANLAARYVDDLDQVERAAWIPLPF